MPWVPKWMAITITGLVGAICIVLTFSFGLFRSSDQKIIVAIICIWMPFIGVVMCVHIYYKYYIGPDITIENEHENNYEINVRPEINDTDIESIIVQDTTGITGDCYICLNPLVNNTNLVFPCTESADHVLHAECYKTMRETQDLCALCRAPLYTHIYILRN